MNPSTLLDTLPDVRRTLEEALDELHDRPTIDVHETGWVTDVGRGVVHVEGLPGVTSEELVEIGPSALGIALDLDTHRIGVVLLDQASRIGAGTEVRRTGRTMDTPVGDALLGRVVDPAGRPRDGGEAIRTSDRLPAE